MWRGGNRVARRQDDGEVVPAPTSESMCDLAA
jgi:hypothetical protein